MKRIEKIFYTLKHKKAFLKVEKELFGKNSLSGYLHDLDKIPMYLIFGVGITRKLHRKLSRHHMEFILPKYIDYKQAFIDFECARYTKLDKQLDGWKTIDKYYPEHKNKFEKVINKP